MNRTSLPWKLLSIVAAGLATPWACSSTECHGPGGLCIDVPKGAAGSGGRAARGGAGGEREGGTTGEAGATTRGGTGGSKGGTSGKSSRGGSATAGARTADLGGAGNGDGAGAGQPGSGGSSASGGRGVAGAGASVGATNGNGGAGNEGGAPMSGGGGTGTLSLCARLAELPVSCATSPGGAGGEGGATDNPGWCAVPDSGAGGQDSSGGVGGGVGGGGIGGGVSTGGTAGGRGGAFGGTGAVGGTASSVGGSAGGPGKGGTAASVGGTGTSVGGTGTSVGGGPGKGGAGGRGSLPSGGGPPSGTGGPGGSATTPPTLYPIDDLEDGDVWLGPVLGARGTWYTASSAGGSIFPPTSCPTSTPATAFESHASNYAMHVYGTGFGATDAFAQIGIAVRSGAPACAEPLDADEMDGIRFWAKGTSSLQSVTIMVATPNEMPIQLGGTCIDGCYDYFRPDVPEMLDDQWREYFVPFSNLRNRQGTFDLFQQRILNIIWQASEGVAPLGVQGDCFDFWLDDVAFYKNP